MLKRWLNASQTCVPPDYVLVDQRISGHSPRVGRTVKRFHPRPAGDDYSAILRRSPFQRLAAMLEAEIGCRIVAGQTVEHGSVKLPPTL
ncbi:hypothetical protein DSL92_01265 [Billgrantia gudaonensis]|uniref:Uncharacterized protein n=1 Tax=Billgrantia gudaonensis TaxID=376427 RepID=A0A3S0NF71_9GAMM|nr:hypothetical protein DSL92_01265 [Halomonas gudaonensis]